VPFQFSWDGGFDLKKKVSLAGVLKEVGRIPKSSQPPQYGNSLPERAHDSCHRAQPSRGKGSANRRFSRTIFRKAVFPNNSRLALVGPFILVVCGMGITRVRQRLRLSLPATSNFRGTVPTRLADNQQIWHAIANRQHPCLRRGSGARVFTVLINTPCLRARQNSRVFIGESGFATG